MVSFIFIFKFEISVFNILIIFFFLIINIILKNPIKDIIIILAFFIILKKLILYLKANIQYIFNSMKKNLRIFFKQIFLYVFIY